MLGAGKHMALKSGRRDVVENNHCHKLQLAAEQESGLFCGQKEEQAEVGRGKSW